MPDTPDQRSSADPAKTAFESWLDSIVPAVIPSDAELARRVGVNQSYVSRWRRGRRPQVQYLVKLADVTGTNLETLLRIVGHVPGPETKP